MSTIWKTELQATTVQHVEVPDGAELLTAREQFGSICIWFRCDPSRPPVKRPIAVCGTGHPAPDDGRYIGTAFMHGGQLVFHVFEKSEFPTPPSVRE